MSDTDGMDKGFGDRTREWAVKIGSELVPFEAADATLLLSAASGLASALVNAGNVSLAVDLAAAYLRLHFDEGAVPISVLTYVSTPDRSFPAVCLAKTIELKVEKQRLHVPIQLIRSIKASRQSTWSLHPKVTVELLDGSVYRRARLETRQLEFLTLVGPQTLDIDKRGITVRGQTVAEVATLRERLEFVLERYGEAARKTVGKEIFERYFQQAA